MNNNRKRFIFHGPTRDMQHFEAVARQAARLKPYGDVLLVISDIADKGFHEIPDGGSGWHEYAVNSPGLHRIFPHPRIAPHVPDAFVRKNRELMLAKAEILDGLGLQSAYWGVEPFFMPASFWRKYPHLRGPRVDHPRRSTREEFSLCVDHPENREMIVWMMAELRRTVPNLNAFIFKTNDAGGSLCWSAALYAGVQGPQHCQSVTPGQRVANYVDALHEGAREGGGDVPVYIGHCNFWNNEIYDILRLLPDNTEIANRSERTMNVGSLISSAFPVRGMVNPLATLTAMERYHQPEVATVFVDFRASYDRATESEETVARVLDLVIRGIEHPTDGLMSRLHSLQAVADEWAGDQAEPVFDAFYRLDQALSLRAACATRGLQGPSPAVQMRYVTRPLVIKPERLTAEEEGYFLPHVFNVDREEARHDYIDWAGGRVAGPALDVGMPPGWHRALSELLKAATALEGAPDGQNTFLFGLATALRVYVSIGRSQANFYFAQLIRDRNADRLAAPPATAKRLVGGTDDLMRWNRLMQDELDNTQELIRLLDARGLHQIAHAPDAEHEDIFLLGPDLLDQLRRKVSIMHEHWLDAEGYLQPPNK